MWILLLGFARNYWKQLALGVGVLALIFVIYNKGRKDCELATERATRKELVKRYTEAEEEATKNDRITYKIKEDLDKTPINDQRDSCLLSNDPFRTKCVK